MTSEPAPSVALNAAAQLQIAPVHSARSPNRLYVASPGNPVALLLHNTPARTSLAQSQQQDVAEASLARSRTRIPIPPIADNNVLYSLTMSSMPLALPPPTIQ